MRYSTTFAVAAIAAAAGLAPLPSAAAVDVYLSYGPPAVIYEPVPAPRVGYVWAPGYWDWNGHRHVWRRGHWVHERHGHRYVAGGWRQYNGRWYLNHPHWERSDYYGRNYYGNGRNYYGNSYSRNDGRWRWDGDRWVHY